MSGQSIERISQVIAIVLILECDAVVRTCAADRRIQSITETAVHPADSSRFCRVGCVEIDRRVIEV